VTWPAGTDPGAVASGVASYVIAVKKGVPAVTTSQAPSSCAPAAGVFLQNAPADATTAQVVGLPPTDVAVRVCVKNKAGNLSGG